MTLIAPYVSKKDLKAQIGKRLAHIETSMFGDEYRSNGTYPVCNRPHITGIGREWFAEVTMVDDIITKVT
jgi:hypothetical protein